jgi:hypothetical protein
MSEQARRAWSFVPDKLSLSLSISLYNFLNFWIRSDETMQSVSKCARLCSPTASVGHAWVTPRHRVVSGRRILFFFLLVFFFFFLSL